MVISSNTLFHFTDSIHNLISILVLEFHPKYCLESFSSIFPHQKLKKLVYQRYLFVIEMIPRTMIIAGVYLASCGLLGFKCVAYTGIHILKAGELANAWGYYYPQYARIEGALGATLIACGMLIYKNKKRTENKK